MLDSIKMILTNLFIMAKETFERIYEAAENNRIFEAVYNEYGKLDEMNPKLKALIAAGLIGTAGLGMQSCNMAPEDDLTYEMPAPEEKSMVEQLGLGELKDKMMDGTGYRDNTFRVIGGENNYLYTGKGNIVGPAISDLRESGKINEAAYLISKDTSDGTIDVWLLKSAITPEQFAKLCAELNIQ